MTDDDELVAAYREYVDESLDLANSFDPEWTELTDEFADAMRAVRAKGEAFTRKAVASNAKTL